MNWSIGGVYLITGDGVATSTAFAQVQQIVHYREPLDACLDRQKPRRLDTLHHDQKDVLMDLRGCGA